MNIGGEDMAGQKIREARGDRSQREVANALGISVSALSMYENDVRVPRDGLKTKMADYFHTTVGSLFFNEEVQ